MRRIPALAVLSLALLLLLLLPTTAAAQAADTNRTARPLAIPRAELRCRTLPLTAEDSARGAAIQLEFEMGDVRSPEERSLRVAYDRSGRPVSLIAMVTFASRERGIVFHGISARFGRGGDAVGVHARHAQGIADTTQPRRGAPSGNAITKTLESLTAQEQREARALAAFLWTKRCG